MTSWDDAAVALQMVATVGAAAALLCRLSAMDGETTPASVRRQHAGLFGALVLSLALPSSAGQAVLAMGVLQYLAHGAASWAFGPPWGSNAPPSGWESRTDQ